MNERYYYYLKTQVYETRPEYNQNSDKHEFRVFHSGGNCKSDIHIEPGNYRLKIKPMAIKDRFYIRILKIAKRLSDENK